MKYLYSISLFLFLSFNVAQACTCNNIPSFCQLAHQSETDERILVWIGELIETITFDESYFVSKFKVVEIIAGEIILPDSPLADADSEYENSETEIWVFGGSGAGCLYESYDSLSLFACGYYSVGYQPDICSTSYLPIDELMNVTGSVLTQNATETVSLDDVRNILDLECLFGVNSNDFTSLIDGSFSKINNLVDHSLSFYFDNQWISEVDVKMISQEGNCVQNLVINQSGNYTIDTSDLPSGMYFLQFMKEGNQYCKKIIKH